jgi:hypothetical protein
MAESHNITVTAKEKVYEKLVHDVASILGNVILHDGMDIEQIFKAGHIILDKKYKAYFAGSKALQENTHIAYASLQRIDVTPMDLASLKLMKILGQNPLSDATLLKISTFVLDEFFLKMNIKQFEELEKMSYV